MKNLEYDEFEADSAARWEELVVKELKGKSIDDITWEVEPGIQSVPFSSENDYHDRGLFRAKVEGSYQWRIQQEFDLAVLSNPSQKIIESLSLGVNSIRLKGTSSWEEVQAALANVKTEAIQVQVSVDGMDQLRSFMDAMESDRVPNNIALEISPQATISETKVEVECLKKAVESGRPLFLVSTKLADQGAPSALELGVTLALAHEALLDLLNHGTVDEVTPLIRFQLGIGQSYLTEISKFRAFRMLWNKVVEAYDPGHDCSGYSFIHAESSTWQMTHADSHTNLLRLTTACASAAIGGADTIQLHPYDMFNQRGDHDAQRISTNIHNVLLWEGRLGVTSDPVEGSYFIEDLTTKLGDVAWGVFRKIEESGGYRKAQKSGALESLISDSINENVERQKQEGTLIGVNKYQHASGKDSESPEGSRLENILKD